MTTYDLYLESGPKRRKTMVHVLDLLGCVAVGPTTEEAIAATPDAIRSYLRFLRRHGEAADPDAPLEVRVVEHVTEGDWLGNGSPYIAFTADLEPVTQAEIETYAVRLRGLCAELGAWADDRSDAELDAPPVAGRTGRHVLLHVLGAQGAYLSPVLGGAPGFYRLHGAAERGELPVGEALRRAAALGEERIRGTTAAERSLVREQPPGTTRTLRKAIRRMLEHDWEHLAELARRPGGPNLAA